MPQSARSEKAKAKAEAVQTAQLSVDIKWAKTIEELIDVLQKFKGVFRSSKGAPINKKAMINKMQNVLADNLSADELEKTLQSVLGNITSNYGLRDKFTNLANELIEQKYQVEQGPHPLDLVHNDVVWAGSSRNSQDTAEIEAREKAEAVGVAQFRFEVEWAKSIDELIRAMQSYQGPFRSSGGTLINKDVMIEKMRAMTDSKLSSRELDTELMHEIDAITSNYGIREKLNSLAVDLIELKQQAEIAPHARQRLQSLIDNLESNYLASSGVHSPPDTRKAIVTSLKSATQKSNSILNIDNHRKEQLDQIRDALQDILKHDPAKPESIKRAYALLSVIREEVGSDMSPLATGMIFVCDNYQKDLLTLFSETIKQLDQNNEMDDYEAAVRNKRDDSRRQP